MILDMDAVEHLPGLDDPPRRAGRELRERVAAGAVDAGEAEDVDGLARADAELEPGILGCEPLARAGADRPGRRRPRRRSRRHGRHRRRPSTGSRSRRDAARPRSRRRNAGASDRPLRPAGSRPGRRRRRSRRLRFPGPRSRRRTSGARCHRLAAPPLFLAKPSCWRCSRTGGDSAARNAPRCSQARRRTGSRECLFACRRILPKPLILRWEPPGSGLWPARG